MVCLLENYLRYYQQMRRFLSSSFSSFSLDLLMLFFCLDHPIRQKKIFIDFSNENTWNCSSVVFWMCSLFRSFEGSRLRIKENIDLVISSFQYDDQRKTNDSSDQFYPLVKSKNKRCRFSNRLIWIFSSWK